MSIKTWKKQYYPIPARRRSKAKALDHSILKWIGVAKAALERHGLVKQDESVLIDWGGNRFGIDSSTCALCEWFNCGSIPICPIGLVTDTHCATQYNHWLDTGDAKPMLALLRKVKRGVAKRGKVKKAV